MEIGNLNVHHTKNGVFITGDHEKSLNDIKGCRHCGGGEENYCESCYQELIAENARLQNIINKIPIKVKRRFDQKNRILIPTGIMKEVNMTEDDEVLVYVENGKVTIEKIN